MHYERGLIVLDTWDLDLMSDCPFSVTLAKDIKEQKECVRCNAFSELARYCLLRSFKNTNQPSEKRLNDKYKHILLAEGVDEETRKHLVRKDAGVLPDILHFSKTQKDYIDTVEPEININFGRFSVRDKLDAILCIQGRYYITKFMCDDHPVGDRDLLRQEMIVGSLWVREQYEIAENGVCFVQLSRDNYPVVRLLDMIPTTEKLRCSIENIISPLEPTEPIKSESAFNTYKQQQLAHLPIKFGNHCWSCQACLKF